jgi:hypothetical protein
MWGKGAHGGCGQGIKGLQATRLVPAQVLIHPLHRVTDLGCAAAATCPMGWVEGRATRPALIQHSCPMGLHHSLPTLVLSTGWAQVYQPHRAVQQGGPLQPRLE